MIYDHIQEGVFISRPNRFIARVELDGRDEVCHVKNTGRCRELLIPGAKVYVNRSGNPARATKYDLVAVHKGERLINMDSQAPNQVFLEHLRSGQYISGISHIQTEARYRGSRFDFYVEAGQRKLFIEVKGVTLEEDGVVMFPDAPTARGVKHLNELTACTAAGYEAQVVFVVQMRDVKYFMPNTLTHPAFGEALAGAGAAGVKIAVLDCEVKPDGMAIRDPVPFKMKKWAPTDSNRGPSGYEPDALTN